MKRDKAESRSSRHLFRRVTIPLADEGRENEKENRGNGIFSGSPLFEGDMQLKHEYDATIEMGIPITLIDTVIEHDDGSIEIPNLNMLLATVAVARVLTPVQMVGAELRFLRHVLQLTGTGFADAIGLSDKSVVSRWENDKTRVGGFTDKIIRQLVLNLLGDCAPGIDIEQNSIPGMQILMRETAAGPLPMAFCLKKQKESKDHSQTCFADAAYTLSAMDGLTQDNSSHPAYS